MGVSIGNKLHSIDGGYSMMFIIRSKIAECYDKELGEHYSNMTLANSPCEKHSYWDKMNTILSCSERFKDEDKDLFDFLFMPDCCGKIKYSTCMKIYNLIKDVDNFPVGYYGTNQTFNDFKNIVRECYSKRMNLRWY